MKRLGTHSAPRSTFDLSEFEYQRTPTAQDPTTTRNAGSVVGPPTASIVQIYGPGLGRRHLLTQETVIGRDPNVEVTIDLSGVSRRHARLFERDGSWWITDLGSTNGTFLDETEIHGATLLASGNALRIGGAIFKFLAGGDIEALYHEEIYRLTITDGLTGIPNKRYFFEQLAREMARARRRQRSLWVVMLDLDHFKTLNDTYGHVTGDHLLQQLAQLLQAQVRTEEVVARYGGEEFAFVLPEAEPDEVKQFCERVRALVEEHVFIFDNKRHHLTVSLGASAMRSTQAVEGLVRAADKQLYRAKELGRNQAWVEPTDEEEP